MFRKRIRNINAKAKELLLADENHLTLIFSIVIFALALILPFIAYYMAYGYVNENYLIISFLLVEMLVSFPIFFGMIRIAGLASKKEDMGLLDVFYAFGSGKNYLKVLFLGVVQTFKHLIPILIGCVLAHLTVYAFDIPSDLSIWVVFAFAVPVYALFLPLIVRLYAVNLLVLTDGEGVISAVKLSWKYTRKNVAFLSVYPIRRLPLLIISIAAICVPLVIYTMPFMFCAYAVNCRKMILEKQNDICPEKISTGVEEINEQDS